jgi:hypothetical protein
VIGIPEYQLTAVVWIRGILAEHYGVPLDSARYRTGGLDDPGRTEKLQVNVPAGVDVRPIPADHPEPVEQGREPPGGQPPGYRGGWPFRAVLRVLSLRREILVGAGSVRSGLAGSCHRRRPSNCWPPRW